MKRRLLCLAAALIFALSLAVPVCAAADTDATLGYVTDSAALLTPQEAALLEAEAKAVSEAYQCGIYIITVEDYTDYSYTGDVYDAAQEIYEEYHLGFGPEKEGVLLLLSMYDRDYALICHGDTALSVFSFEAQEYLEDAFLDELGKNDWYGGFADYIAASETLLESAASGNPMFPEAQGNVLISVLGVYLIACVISGVICLIMLGQMKTANKRTTAADYIGKQGVQMRISTDRFTHATQVRRKIQTANSSGGNSVARQSTPRSGGGYSGRKGKF